MLQNQVANDDGENITKNNKTNKQSKFQFESSPLLTNQAEQAAKVKSKAINLLEHQPATEKEINNVNLEQNAAKTSDDNTFTTTTINNTTANVNFNNEQKAAKTSDDNTFTTTTINNTNEKEQARVCVTPGCSKKEGKLLKFKLCGACRSSAYCSQACQKSHWKIHKRYCKAIANDDEKSTWKLYNAWKKQNLVDIQRLYSLILKGVQNINSKCIYLTIDVTKPDPQQFFVKGYKVLTYKGAKQTKPDLKQQLADRIDDLASYPDCDYLGREITKVLVIWDLKQNGVEVGSTITIGILDNNNGTTSKKVGVSEEDDDSSSTIEVGPLTEDQVKSSNPLFTPSSSSSSSYSRKQTTSSDDTTTTTTTTTKNSSYTSSIRISSISLY